MHNLPSTPLSPLKGEMSAAGRQRGSVGKINHNLLQKKTKFYPLKKPFISGFVALLMIKSEVEKSEAFNII